MSGAGARERGDAAAGAAGASSGTSGAAGAAGALRPAPWLAGFAAYRTAPAGAPCDLRLDGNEGIEPPLDDLVEALRAAGPDVARRYPDATRLRARLAERVGVEPERVLVTAGADASLDRVCRAFLGAGREIVLTAPTFEMLPRYAALSGASVREVAWGAGAAFPAAAIEAAIGEATHVVAIVTPNNPTGAVASAGELVRLAAAHPSVLFLVDLAYVEFADEDPTGALLPSGNVVMTRTLSKAWGLAGLRVGFAVGAAEVIGWLRAAGGPYDVARSSLAMAEARLEGAGGDVAAFVSRVRREREELRAMLGGLGVAAHPSQGNFVLCEPRDALWLRDGLAGLGIAVRAFPGRAGLERSVRITCPGRADEFARLDAALRATLRPEALLFDLDGVLADVSRSFREAILATAATYGVALTHADVAAIKREGNANNDWDVTQRLLARHGIVRPLDEVTARFEDIYQGSERAPGLRATETPIVERALLERLAARRPLAIVTGRPRCDARRFLVEKELDDLFGAVVCMEDAPVKPDPAPVRRALERLGVAAAWMIGDTPDDVRAARAAGVVPLGVVPPGDAEPDATARSLVAAGAARVLDDLSQLEELMP